MFRNLRSSSFTAACIGLAVCLCIPIYAEMVPSGQRTFGQVEIEPAIDSANGNTVFLLTPLKSPFPSKANKVATAPMYLPMYPLNSTVSAFELNCQANNCDHVNVLPFPSLDYGALPGSDPRCMDFNGGAPCSPVKGHDHLVGIASTGGDFNVAWHVQLVVFTPAAFLDGKINTRIKTLSQLQALLASKDVILVDTPVTFNCSSTSERTYDIGTPVMIPFP